MLQTIIVIAAVALAGWYIIRRTVRQTKGSDSGCGCGCSCDCGSGNHKIVDILDSPTTGDKGPGN